MGTQIVAWTIALLLFIMIIFWQIFLLMAQRTKQMELQKDYEEFKEEVEQSWKKEINEMVELNRELIKTITKLIENKKKDDRV